MGSCDSTNQSVSGVERAHLVPLLLLLLPSSEKTREKEGQPEQSCVQAAGASRGNGQLLKRVPR